MTSMTRSASVGLRIGAVGSLMVILSIALTACAASSSSDGGVASPGATPVGGPSAEAPVTDPTAAASTGSDQGEGGVPPGIPAMEGGSATITIAGNTVDFPFFVCMGGDTAVEYTGQDAMDFVAIGQGTDGSGATTTIVVSRIDTALGPNLTVLYRVGGGADALGWQLVGADAAQIVGNQVSSEGDFSRLVDGTPTDDTDPGSLAATCSPGSVGLG